MSVNTEHPEYQAMKAEWSLVKACASGSREVKALKTDVLPAPGAVKGVYDADRYASYLLRAIYTNVTGRTKTGLTGAAFRIPGEIELPSGLQYLEEDADGAGQSIKQLTKDTFANLLETGRECLLVDHPSVEEGLTEEETQSIRAQAAIKLYGALSLINWKVDSVGGREVLTLAVLQEQYNGSDEEFLHMPKLQYRVLRLRDGAYSQQVYRDGNPIEDERFPTQSNGSKFDFIPLFIIGGQNNDASVDNIPLSDIAHVNVGHYRNSADLEESSYIVGQPMIHIDIGDTDANQWKELNGAENGVAFGSNTSVQTVKGSVDMVQVSENQIADKLQERKEGQMLALGAKLVEQRNPNETAAAAKIDATGENSVLGDLVANVEEGMLRAIEWCGLFMGEQGNITFELNRQFFNDEELTPEQINALMAMWQGAAISKDVLDHNLVKGKVIPDDVDLKAMNNQIDNELPEIDLDGGTTEKEKTNDS